MDLKSMVVLEFKKNDRIYQLLMPVGAPYGEAYDVCFEALNGILEMAKKAADAAEKQKEETKKESNRAAFEKVENDVEDFPLPTMMKIWMKHFPEYYQSTKDDFPALNKICEQINKRSAALLDKQKLTEFAERFAAAVKLHKFYKDKSLKTIANHLQDILPIYNDPDGYVKKMSAPKYETDQKSVKIVLNNGQSAAYAENRHIKIRI